MRKTTMRKTTILLTALGLLASSSAFALDGKQVYMKRTCVACHGKDAKTPVMPNYPRLAGQNEPYLLQQMKDIKSGARHNGMTAAMKTVMHLVSEEEMAAVAKWLSGLK
jgi:cytochrome c